MSAVAVCQLSNKQMIDGLIGRSVVLSTVRQWNLNSEMLIKVIFWDSPVTASL